MPILEGTATRQVQTAMIARNYHEDGYNILYPKVDHLGAGENYLIIEFPLLNCLTAIGYDIVGGVSEWIGRLWGILFFAGGLIFLYLLVKEIFDKDTAFWAGLVFSFSPLSIIYSRTIMPDFEMLFFSLGSIYYMYIYLLCNKIKHFWTSAILAMIAFLVKLPAIYIIPLLAFLLFRREKNSILFKIKNWSYLLVSVLPALLWYLRAAQVQRSLTPQEAYNYDVSHWIVLGEFLSIEFYKDLLNIFSGVFLTPIGFSLLILGLFVKKDKDQDKVLWVWLGSIILFIIVFVSHIDEPYYSLNILPLASIFIARAIIFIKDYDWKNNAYLSSNISRIAFIMIASFLILRFSLYAYMVPKGYRYIPELGKRIQTISAPDDLIVASSAASPAALYYCDRQGWPFHLPGPDKNSTKDAIERLENLRNEGAKLFCSAVKAEFDRSVFFKEYMFKNYKIVEHKKDKYIIFNLQ